MGRFVQMGDRLRVAVCDDEERAVFELKRMVERELKRERREYEIVTCFSGEELLGVAAEMDLIFLDISMPGLDGIEVGRRVSIANRGCRIVMATGHLERVKEAFKIQAFRFISKPFDREEIREAISAYLAGDMGREEIDLYYERNQYCIQQRKIAYIRTINGAIEAKVNNIMFRKEISLKELATVLDKRIFVKARKNYYVNMLYIEGYKDGLLRVSGDEIKASRREKKAFEKTWKYFGLHY